MLRRLIVCLLAAALLAARADATWSIVVVDLRTREVCVASATCLGGFDLKPNLALLRVGTAAGAAQSVVDTGALNRMRIWAGIDAGLPPQQIIESLAPTDPQHQRRQYGLVDLTPGHAPATFTGTQVGQARFGVSGQVGDLRYAIQGNLLTGAVVVQAAEQALLGTSGDLSQRVMAAMEAARAMGGDGRCSCSQLQPTSCGAPPASFTYSAYTAFIVLARLGDVDGVCNDGQGCANGSYHLDLKVISGGGGPEPVLRLQQDYDSWRLSRQAWADQLLTRVLPGAQRLPADGLSSVDVEVRQFNLDGLPVEWTPTTYLFERLGDDMATLSPVTDLGGGRQRFTLTSNGQLGRGRWKITLQQPGRATRLWPDLELRAEAPAALFCGLDELSAARGGVAPLWIRARAAAAGAPYLVLASAAGTSPGVMLGGLLLPLNRDRLLSASFAAAGSGLFAGTAGTLDAAARAQARFSAPPGLLAGLVGARIDWAALIGSGPDAVTGSDGFLVVP